MESPVDQDLLIMKFRADGLKYMEKINSLSVKKKLENSNELWVILVAKFAIFFSNDLKDHLVSQFEKSVTSNGWFADDIPANRGSMKTSLNLLKHLQPKKFPKVSCDHDGGMILSWKFDDQLTSFTCVENNKVFWHNSYYVNKKFKHSAGQCKLSELEKKLPKSKIRNVLGN